MSSRAVIDWEATGLDKPFGYDIGYHIVDNDTNETLCERQFIIEQNWHNLPLFESAYYKDKRPLYVSLLRARKAIMTKYGYAMRQFARDIKQYNVTDIYAYNSDFDDKVTSFNCDWFKCINPIETIPIHDIWGYASQFITNTPEYKDFCEKYGFFTDTGNYKTSAEVVYRFITNDPTFEEAHMGLQDAQIEAKILEYCFSLGAEKGKDYKVTKIVKRPRLKDYTIKINGKIVYKGKYLKKYIRDDVYSFTEPEVEAD